MKIDISEDQRSEIDAVITNTSAQIDTLSSTVDKLERLGVERTKSEEKARELESVEVPSEKQTLDLLVSRARATNLSTLIDKISAQAESQKRVVILEANLAQESLRRAVSKPLEDATKKRLIDSLPDSVKANTEVLGAIWAGSQERRSLGQFMNPRPVSQKDDAETVIGEAEKIMGLLRDLLAGRDIAPPSVATQTAAV